MKVISMMAIKKRMNVLLLLGILPLCLLCNSDSPWITHSYREQQPLFTVSLLPRPDLHWIQDVPRITQVMGTAEHPTLDGGVVNLANNEQINAIYPQTVEKHTNQQIKMTGKKEKTEKVAVKDNAPRAFEDSWVTSQRVKHLLKSASENGKLKFVLKKAEQFHLPATVAVVPMVESNYRENAVSAEGAAGVWQLMPSVSHDYGIKNQDRFVFNTSTVVALKLIKDLYKKFGNWTLVFAAYNAGSQRIKDAIQKNPRANSLDELDIPLETKRYVKRIQAITQILMTINVNER